MPRRSLDETLRLSGIFVFPDKGFVVVDNSGARRVLRDELAQGFSSLTSSSSSKILISVPYFWYSLKRIKFRVS